MKDARTVKTPRMKRSVPTVDSLPQPVREQLSAAALTAAKGYERAYEQTLAMLVSMRRIQIATLVGIGLLASFIAVMTYARSRELEGLRAHDQIQDSRLDALEHHQGDPKP